jgi:Kef-type K+ transport system membrane component KefB
MAARLTGSGWKDSVAIGVLMNTRGLMELVVLNIGLDLGVISPVLFAMLVIMALATTLATAPILHFVVGAQFSYNKEARAI